MKPLKFPFVSSEVEAPRSMAPSPMGISTSLDANGLGRRARGMMTKVAA
jgi:hypothetical protein